MCHSRCVQALPEFYLIPRPGANNDNGDVRFLCGFDRLVESRLIVAPPFASLGVVDQGLIPNRRLNSVQWGNTSVLAFVDNIIAILEKEISIKVFVELN